MREKDVEWASNTLKKVIDKMDKVVVRSAEKIPYSTVGKVHDDWSSKDKIGWWTNGFWGGMMWQLYSATGNENYRKAAEKTEEKLDAVFMNWDMLDHDNGFRWLPTAVANYRYSGSEESKNRGMLAANNLAGRYNPVGEFIRAWNGDEKVRGWAIIDCMMNLPLLYWASEVTSDPRFEQVAIKHAKTTAKNFLRENGSVKHITEFDAATGDYVKGHGGQGMRDGSSWTRGQSWGLYGFVLSYIHTKDSVFLDTAMKIADNYISNIPDSGLIPVDFDQPKEIEWQDSTSAAIASCGLLELYKLLPEQQGEKYYEAAMLMLKALTENSLNLDEECDNLMEKCSASYNEERHDFPIIYGDYYFIEALNKISGKELFIW